MSIPPRSEPPSTVRPAHVLATLLVGCLSHAATMHGSDQAPPEPVHLAVAGGGFYSHTHATGWLAAMMDLWDTGDPGVPLANVRSMSGISGGSWFLTHIGYSEAFIEQLASNRDGWTDSSGYLGRVRDAFEGFEAFDCSVLPGGGLQDLCETVAILNPVFSVLQSAGDILDPRWQETCEAIVFEPFGMRSALQGVRLADLDARPAWAREKDFIFTTVASGWNDVLCNRYVFPFSLLNQYVSSTDASAGQPFGVPMLWSGVAAGRTAPDLLPGGPLELTYFEQGMSPGDGTTVTIGRNDPSDITVLGATAASSAAGGVASSYEFYRESLGFSPQIANTLGNYLRNLSVPLRLTDSGFRTRGNVPSASYQDLAGERYLRISDGGIHDSTSVTALLHHLERNQELEGFEIILLDPSFFPLVSCAPGEVPLARSVAFLFGYSAKDPFLCLELGGTPGPSICLEDDPCSSSVPTARIQVFEAGDWPTSADVAWSWQGIDEPTGAQVDLRILSIPVTTIANPDFDLPAGRSGRLHVFSGSTQAQDGIPLSGANLDAYDAMYRMIRVALAQDDNEEGRQAVFDALNLAPTAPCIADLDGDGERGGADLAILLSFWGEDAPGVDVDGDGVVGGTDLATLLAFWGPCASP